MKPIYVEFTSSEYEYMRESALKRNVALNKLSTIVGLSSPYFRMSVNTGRIRKDVKDYVFEWINDPEMEISKNIFQREILVKNTINYEDLKTAMKNSKTTIAKLSLALGKQKSYISRINDCKKLPKSVVKNLEQFISKNT